MIAERAGCDPDEVKRIRAERNLYRHILRALVIQRTWRPWDTGTFDALMRQAKDVYEGRVDPITGALKGGAQ